MGASRILAEIKQTKPFASLEQEVAVAFLKTEDHLRRMKAGLFEPHGLTEQQYNVLRILRGAGKDGLCTLAVADRLIEHTPGITRLIDRLETKCLVRRERAETDRRQVYCFVTKAALELLTKLDPEVEKSAKRAFSQLKKAEMKSLLDHLEKIRDAR